MKYQYKREPLTAEELEKLYVVTEDFKDKLILYTLLDTGLRVSEFCGLTKNSILWQRDAIRVTNGKGDRKRTVPMTPRVKALLSTQFAMSNKMPFKELMVQLRVKRLAEKAGITKKVTPHVLRHTFAVMALRKGVDIRALQKVLGHESLETTAIYLNYDDETTMKSFRDAGWL